MKTRIAAIIAVFIATNITPNAASLFTREELTVAAAIEGELWGRRYFIQTMMSMLVKKSEKRLPDAKAWVDEITMATEKEMAAYSNDPFLQKVFANAASITTDLMIRKFFDQCKIKSNSGFMDVALITINTTHDEIAEAGKKAASTN
jgi:hypothetical protein